MVRRPGGGALGHPACIAVSLAAALGVVVVAALALVIGVRWLEG